MDRYGYGSSEEHQPLLWVRGYGLYAAHLLVAVYAVSLLVTTVNPAYFAFHLGYGSPQVWAGQVWRIFTYGFVNPPSLGFLIDMVMLVWFGREVEKFFGRTKFLWLYAGIYLLPPLALTALGRWFSSGLEGAPGSLAVFVAFATLYPNVALIFNVLAKWAAVLLVGIYVLMALAGRSWPLLATIVAANGFAFGFVRFQQGHFSLPRFRFPSRKPKLRVVPDLPATKPAAAKSTPQAASMAEVDALLDKIATSGMASLTPKERAKLDAARQNLMKRESGRM